MPIQDVFDLRQCLIDARYRAMWKLLLMNGIRDFRAVWMKTNILISYYEHVIFRLKCRSAVMWINWTFLKILCSGNV